MAKMIVDKQEAADLCKAVGLVIADKWDATKLKERLAAFDKIQGVQEKVAGIEDEDLQKLGKKTLAACKAGVSIFVTESVPLTEVADDSQEEETVSDETEVETKPAKKVVMKVAAKPTKPSAKSKPGKPVKPAAKVPAKGDKPAKEKKESSVVKDAWGTRTGTRTARINAALLAGKPVTTAEIEAKAQAHGIHSHLTKLKEMKYIEKTPEGKYQATKLGMSKKAAK